MATKIFVHAPAAAAAIAESDLSRKSGLFNLLRRTIARWRQISPTSRH